MVYAGIRYRLSSSCCNEGAIVGYAVHMRRLCCNNCQKITSNVGNELYCDKKKTG
jgi:hypothetical protein